MADHPGPLGPESIPAFGATRLIGTPAQTTQLSHTHAGSPTTSTSCVGAVASKDVPLVFASSEDNDCLPKVHSLSGVWVVNPKLGRIRSTPRVSQTSLRGLGVPLGSCLRQGRT